MTSFLGVPVVTLLVVTLTLVTWPHVEGYWKAQRKRCCGPDVWEARLVNLGTTNRQQYFYNNMDVRFAFDLPKNRWAIDQVHSEDASRNIKYVFDFNKGKRFAINHVGCYAEVLDVPINPYCVGKNASYLGEWEAGGPAHSVTYQAWTWDIFMYPLRHTMVVSKENCLPIKETTWGLVQNIFAWDHGQPACNPYEDKEVFEAGECYKSFKKESREYHGTQPTANTFNIDFVDVNLTISQNNEDLFEVPPNCQDETWVDNIQGNDFSRILIMRMKYYDEIKDAPIIG